jgi:hypothetical protein
MAEGDRACRGPRFSREAAEPNGFVTAEQRAEDRGLKSRSAALQRAIRMLRHPALATAQQYGAFGLWRRGDLNP